MNNIKTRVVHSESKSAWNVIGTLGGKYKIARCPYEGTRGSTKLAERNRKEAFEIATFISNAFNNTNKEACDDRQFLVPGVRPKITVRRVKY